jgi:hypothetical protein
MTAEKFNTVLAEMSHREPFEIFTVILHGGEHFEVDFPLALGFREGVAVFLTPRGGPIVFNHKSVLQIGPAASGNPDEPP